MFGEILKVDPSTVTEWKSGSRLPTKKHLLKLEALFNNFKK